MVVPDIGDTVAVGVRTYVVDGWLKVVPGARSTTRAGVTRIPLEYCARSDATYLASTGKAVASVADANVTGRVDWPEHVLAEMRRLAMEMESTRRRIAFTLITGGDRCPDTKPHGEHEWYGCPAAIRRQCPGID